MNKGKTMPLDEVCNVEYGTRVVQKRDGGSVYPVYGGGGATFKMDEFNREDRLVIARFGMSEECTRFVAGKFFLNDSGLTVSPKNGATLQRFLDYQMLSLNDNIYALGKGTAQKNLDVPVFRALPLVVPNDTKEQQRIVGILDESFEGIATAKANAEQNLKNARAIFESHLEFVFTQRGKGWVEKKISDLSDFITVGFVGTMAHLFVNEGIPLLRGQNIRPLGIEFNNLKFISKDTHAKWKKSALLPGDVAIVRVGYPGTAAVVPEGAPELNAASLVIVRPNRQRLDSYFLAHALNSEWGKSAIKARLVGAAQQVFNTGTAADLEIPLPPLPEQKALVERFAVLSAETQRLAALYQREIAALEALKMSLLHEAFAGQL